VKRGITLSEPILRLNQISKSFPGVQALNNVSFSLNKGEVLALVGENGAGKSTLIKCLTGAQDLTSGTIEINNQTFKKMDPRQAREFGISAVYQELNLVLDLPVVENVFMGNNPGKGFIVNYNEMLKRAKEIFDSFGVSINPKAELRTLSPGMMQIVEIAKAVALNLNILILDEPTASLTAKETETLFSIIERVKAEGVSVIYISHRLEEIFRICDRIVVLRDGEYVGETAVADTSRQELVKLMIGRELASFFPEHESKATDEIVLKVEGLSGNGVKNISFELHKGEKLGFAGLVGAGRTELMSLLFCAAPKEAGTIELFGDAFAGKHPWQAIASGMALVPEDRKRLSLLLDMSVGINVTLASIKRFSKWGVIKSKLERKHIEQYCTQLQVKTPTIEQEVQFLSGGNQQKVVVAKWLATHSKIIIFDEPTRGIDVGTKHEIYSIINSLVDEGCSVIIVSSEFEELIGITDRIAVMSEGELAGFLNKDEFDKEKLLDLASGTR
jgi:ribose transport system ATP-binding protein